MTAIISFFRNSGNLNEEVVVSATDSYTFNLPISAIDNNLDTLWASPDSPGHSIFVHFIKSSVSISSYCLTQRNDHHDGLLQYWQVYGLSSGAWILIDTQSSPAGFVSTSVSKNFSIASTQSFSSIKFTHNGKSTGNYYFMCIAEIEFYGTIHPINDTSSSYIFCITNNSTRMQTISIRLLLFFLILIHPIACPFSISIQYQYSHI